MLNNNLKISLLNNVQNVQEFIIALNPATKFILTSVRVYIQPI